MNILVTLCARGGSKGIPGKNIKLLNGKPLIYYSLDIALKFSSYVDCDVDIVMSTDSSDIINEVRKHTGFDNVLIRNRPEYLASDTVGKIDVIKDVLEYCQELSKKQYDYVLDLDVTSPMRTVEDLVNALKIIQEDDEAYNLFSVSPANRNPYFNMVELNNEGYASLCKEGTFLTRQSAPKVYDLNASFYFYRPNFFEQNVKSVITKKSLMFEISHLCFDLDHPIDFDFMEFLITKDKLEFEI